MNGTARRILVVGLRASAVSTIEGLAAEVVAEDPSSGGIEALDGGAWDAVVVGGELQVGAATRLARTVSARRERGRPLLVMCSGEQTDPVLFRDLAGRLDADLILDHPLDLHLLTEELTTRLDLDDPAPRITGRAAGADEATSGVPEPSPAPAPDGGGDEEPDARLHVDAGDADALQVAMRGILERARGNLEERLLEIEEAVTAALEDRLDADTRRTGERAAHRLAGTAGTFGLHEATTHARELEQLLTGDSPLGPSEQRHAAEALEALRAAVAADEDAPTTPVGETGISVPVAPPAGAPTGSTTETRTTFGRDLLIVAADLAVEGRIAELAGERRIGIHQVRGIAAARESLRERAADAVLVHLTDPGDGGDPLRFLAELTTGPQPIPAIAMTPTDTFTDRVTAARAGARGFIPESASATQVVGLVQEAFERSRRSRTTILAVDDDPALLAAMTRILTVPGRSVITCSDPREFWDVFTRVEPDLLIIDVEMPHIDGLELTTVVRGDPRHVDLPVLIVTARTDEETLERAFAAGADDFVRKPLIPAELLARVSGRLERTRLRREAEGIDPVTGLPTRTAGEPSLARLVDGAVRLGQAVSFVIVDLDHSERINEQHGFEAGDAVLHRLGTLMRDRLASDDVAIRMAGDEFLLAVPGLSAEEGAGHVAALLEDARAERFRGADDREFRITVSAGVAAFPDDGRTPAELVTAARQAVREAKEAGGDRVARARPGDRPTSVDTVDIVVVEDDDVLGELLLHALETRGYRCRLVADGVGAVEQLGGAAPPLTARLILLDVDLPGLNGLDVLRRLGQDGVLDGTRVIVLTARTTDAATLEALEEGAFDRIAKPFSVPILLQRVRRGLGA